MQARGESGLAAAGLSAAPMRAGTSDMRAVVQRVSEASVTTDGSVCAAIGDGLLVYVGIGGGDTNADTAYLADKVCGLRIFPDEAGQMNRHVAEAGGAILVVSAFTVQADARKGRRPSFVRAAGQETALPLYEGFCTALARNGLTVARGRFGAMMAVRSVNAGPVCILLDSKRSF